MEKEIFNFNLIKVINAEKQFGSKIYIFEHQRTGLKVYYCFPTDFVLNLRVSFYTPQLNNRGTTHILEHLLCHTKSRNKDKWFLPSYINEKTSFNAATFDDYTCFEISSRSITEFRSVTKATFQSVFREKFEFTDEEIAYEAGYIKDYDSVEGVVYNELKRSLEDIECIADEYADMIAYANSHYQYPPGGNIKGVLMVTREELEEYYFKYYKPSNCKIFVSGGLNIMKFFEYLDTTICKDKGREEVEIISGERPIIKEGCRVPFYAPLGYPKGENIYVWGIKLPNIETFEEKAIYELAMKAMFDGQSGPFEYVVENGYAKHYSKSILLDRTGAPCFKIVFFKVPLGYEEYIDELMNKYIGEIMCFGFGEEKFNDAMRGIISEYGRRNIEFYGSEMFDKIYFLLKDDSIQDLSFTKLYGMLGEMTIEDLSEISVALCDEQNQFKFVMYPSVNYLSNLENNILANCEEYKLCTPVIEEYGEIIAKGLRLNGTKQEVTRKLETLTSSLNMIRCEKIDANGVDVYKFDDESLFVDFTFGLGGLTDKEICFIPALVKLINTNLESRDMESRVYVDADVIQSKVYDEYFRLELKCYFKDEEIDLSFFDKLYDLIDCIRPEEIAQFLISQLGSSRAGSSEKLTRDLALRTDSNDIAYRGVIHRRTFFDALFNAGSGESIKELNVFCDFHDACYKVLRRSNLTIMTTSAVLDNKLTPCKPEKLVNAVRDFEDVEQREVIFKDDKELTFHFANLKSSATSIIKVDGLKDVNIGKKMVIDRVLYNFMYILFRQLGLSYQINGTLASDFAMVSTHSIRSCDDYRSSFAACGIYLESFSGNLNHYKSCACDLLLDMFQGALNPKITVFRYIESGISFEEIMSIPKVIEEMTSEDLKEVGEAIGRASYDAKVYAVCGPGSYPSTMDDYTYNRDYTFPDFLI